MRPFWETVIEPLLDASDARVLVESGVDEGGTTCLLLGRAARLEGSVVHAIDPAPKLDVARWEVEHGARIRFHRARSHEVLEGIGPIDAALLDGDHNWFTVYGELELLETTAAAARAVPPLVLVHDARWPYGRRDMYYDPESVPVEHRQEAERSGLVMGRDGLSPEGINSALWNATHEGGGQNGVLTAIEDFLANRGSLWELVVVEGFHGLAVLVPTARLDSSADLRAVFEGLRSPDFLSRWANVLEGARINAEVRAWKAAATDAKADAPEAISQ